MDITQAVPSGPSLEYGRRSGWVERLDMMWRGMVGWMTGKMGLVQCLDIVSSAGRAVRLG